MTQGAYLISLFCLFLSALFSTISFPIASDEDTKHDFIWSMAAIFSLFLGVFVAVFFVVHEPPKFAPTFWADLISVIYSGAAIGYVMIWSNAGEKVKL